MRFSETFPRNTILFLFAALQLIPILSWNAFIYPHVTTKAFFLDGIVCVIFIAYSILCVANEKYRPIKSPLLTSVYLFFILIFLTSFLGVDPFMSFWGTFARMQGLFQLTHYLILAVVLSSIINSKREWDFWISFSFFASIGTILISLFQFSDKTSFYRLDANFGNPGYLSIYCVINIFLGIYVFIHAQYRPWKKALVLVLLMLHLLILYQTNTRAALLAFACGFAVFSFHGMKHRLVFSAKKMLFVFVLFLLFFGVLFATLLLFKSNPLIAGNPFLQRLVDGITLQGTTDARLLVWQIAIDGIWEKPILGCGNGNFEYVFSKYYNPFMYSYEDTYDRIHNMYLEWLLAGGCVVFFSYLAVIGSCLLAIRKNPFYSQTEKGVFYGVITAYLVFSFFWFDDLTTGLYISFFLSIFASQESRGRYFHSLCFNFGIRKYALFVLVGTIATVDLFVNYKIISCNYTIKKLNNDTLNIKLASNDEQITLVTNFLLESNRFSKSCWFSPLESMEYGVIFPIFRLLETIPKDLYSDGDKVVFWKPALEKLETVANSMPTNPRAVFMVGYYWKFVRLHARAQPYLDKAILLSPRRQSFLLASAENCLALGHPEKALALLKTAYELGGDRKHEERFDFIWQKYILCAMQTDTEVYEKLLEEEKSQNQTRRLDWLESHLKTNEK